MSEEAFNEIIDNFEVVAYLTEYGRKGIKENVNKLQARIKELEEENKRLKQIRLEYDFGYENINLITKNDLVKIDKNRYLIEIADGKFVDIKQVYLDNLNSIPVQKVKDKIEEIEDDKVSGSCLDVIRKDIKSAKDYGMECDKEQWLKLLNRIEEVI